MVVESRGEAAADCGTKIPSNLYILLMNGKWTRLLEKAGPQPHGQVPYWTDHDLCPDARYWSTGPEVDNTHYVVHNKDVGLLSITEFSPWPLANPAQ